VHLFGYGNNQYTYGLRNAARKAIDGVTQARTTTVPMNATRRARVA